MPESPNAPLSIARSHAPLVGMGLLLAFVCFAGLNRFALIDLVDEGIYASIARQMLDSGDWITPRYGSTIFFYKPPLTYWFQAFFIYFLGATPLAARLPSALGAFLTGLSIYGWARSRGALRVGRIAATVYMCCPLVAFGLARIAMMDRLVTLFFTLAVIGWIEGYSGERKGYFLMAIGMGLATMTKRPDWVSFAGWGIRLVDPLAPRS
ncbi:MAG: ArnT family glycosyltransferase [Pyrinomonadaceae bacterium]